MAAMWFIVNKRGRSLSGFFSGECENQIEFSRWRRGAYVATTFDTEQEAQEHIDYIRARCNEITAPTAAQLRPSQTAAGWQRIPDKETL